MELKIIPYQLPDKIGFNFDELKAELMEKAKVYEAVIYSDDQIAAAKADRASLNKLKKALNDERIRREKEYLQPFNEFKAQVNEIIRIIDKPAQAIDKQVKEYEERKKVEKRQRIEACWRELLDGGKVPAGIEFRRIFDEKWLNASVSMASIRSAMEGTMEKASSDLDVIHTLPAYAYEAEQTYLATLDLSKAVSEAHRLKEMAERKAAYEAEQAARKAEHAARESDVAARKAAEQAPEPVHTPTAIVCEQDQHKTWLSFKALLSVDDALALREFFEARAIEFSAL